MPHTFQEIELEGPNGGSGVVRIISDPRGPDLFDLTVAHLPANTTLTVFLVHSPTTGALPAQFLGELKTNRDGWGQFFGRTEIVNAFVTANQGLENGQGVANGAGAGALSAGANAIPLDFVRVYLADGGQPTSVFGRSENDPGDGIALLGADQPIRDDSDD